VEDRKETVIGDVNDYEITFDGKKMLVKIKKDYAIIDLPKDKIETKTTSTLRSKASTCSSTGTRVEQIYFRMLAAHAGFLLSADDDGVDWKAMRDKYAALLPFVNTATISPICSAN